MEIGGVLFMNNNNLKGFEITINGKKVNAGVKKGFVLVTLTYKHGIDITGGDDELGVSLQWDKTNISVGDKIKIVALDIKDNVPIPNGKKKGREKLLADYYQLKSYLTKEGLL